MAGPSPGVTIIVVAFGLVLLIFAIWAVCSKLLPHLRHPESEPMNTLPQTTQTTDPKNHQAGLRRSLYGTQKSLFQEPRNDISDYDLKNSRFSTCALDFSRPPSPMPRRPRVQSIHDHGHNGRGRTRSRSRNRSPSHSRSRSRHHSAADLRASLYSDPELLLHNDARSSTFNLIIDQPDAITHGRPRSQYYDSLTTSVRSKSVHSQNRRRSAPLLVTDLSNIVLPYYSSDISSVELITTGPSPLSPYKHLSATSFNNSSRHSLPPNLDGYFSMTNNPRRSPFAYSPGSNTPKGGCTTPPAKATTILPGWPLTTTTSSPLSAEDSGVVPPVPPTTLEGVHNRKTVTTTEHGDRGQAEETNREATIKTPLSATVVSA
ncbi:hypothetical protein LTR47_004799 [Exophiala xenobiotica]|nr:hypothetical protein LTR41_005487 [Exophiala xenobiotica]KAK5234208.1 hypothetical protein LTR47_004799 [Exophiala xenobiotica]KAK5244094.1 hypothetical protein LTS06_010268 [Exophiala xenobiotica]KAK5325169.1 hypothetical protein LTR93_004646 [Exophiala xenobiotica]KAK5352885.1 hypothetical protein LTR61_004013 [Exophiala xenobiotica]